jgi:transcriptional regulator with XRE-family HTH domain
MTPIGRRIRQRREELDLQQGELAELAGVNKGTVNAIEMGHRRPSPGTLEKLAPHLNWTLRELLDPTSSQPAETATHAAPVELSEAIREAVIDLIEDIHAALINRTSALGGQTSTPSVQQTPRDPLRREVRGQASARR